MVTPRKEPKHKLEISKQPKMSQFNIARLTAMLENELSEDWEQGMRLNEAESYLDSEAHVLIENEMLSEYEAEHGSADGYEDMLENKLLDGLQQEESADIHMYNRIFDRINNVSSPDMRNMLLARYSPEILKGRDRSVRLVARARQQLARARMMDARRKNRNVTVSLKPKVKGIEKEHPGRTKEPTGGYPA